MVIIYHMKKTFNDFPRKLFYTASAFFFLLFLLQILCPFVWQLWFDGYAISLIYLYKIIVHESQEFIVMCKNGKK